MQLEKKLSLLTRSAYLPSIPKVANSSSHQRPPSSRQTTTSVDLVLQSRVTCSALRTLAQHLYRPAEHDGEPPYPPLNQPAFCDESILKYALCFARWAKTHWSLNNGLSSVLITIVRFGTLFVITRNNASFSDDTGQGDVMISFQLRPFTYTKVLPMALWDIVQF